MIKKYSFVTDENRVFYFYNKVIGETWPIEKEKFYDILVHKPPSTLVASFISVSQSRVNGFISTQIMNKRGSIVLLLFEEGQEYIGEKLLERALEHFRKNKIENIQFGAGGYTSLWPGIPTNLPDLVAFFEEQHWKFSENSVDMIRDIGNYITPNGIFERIVSLNIHIESLKSEDTRQLITFEQRNFPRWERYFAKTIDEKKLSEALVAKTREGEIIGSVLFRRDDVIWMHLLGENVGTIGVLGVAESMRSKGIGLALAARATEALKQQQVQTCYLSWTWLTDWYGKLGYKVWRDYRMVDKNLS